MATLPAPDLQRISNGLQRNAGLFGSVNNVLKSDLLAAVTATDSWIDSNATSFNNALPTAFKNNASLSQKTMLFCAVALMRVSQSLLEAVLGGVD